MEFFIGLLFLVVVVAGVYYIVQSRKNKSGGVPTDGPSEPVETFTP